MNKYWLLLNGTFLSKPWKHDDESRRKTFLLFVFITASYFLSGETQVVTSAEIPSLHMSENQCPHGWETWNAPGGLWCPGQPVRYQSWRQEHFFVRGHSAEGNDLFPTQSAGLFALHQDSSRLTKLLKSAREDVLTLRHRSSSKHTCYPSFCWTLLLVLCRLKWISSCSHPAAHRRLTPLNSKLCTRSLTWPDSVNMALKKVINYYSQYQFLGL